MATNRAKRINMAGMLFAMLIATTVHAASPQLNRVLPRGGQRGTEIDLVLDGVRLADAKEILFYEPGISVTKLDIVNEKQVKAHVKIEPGAELGQHTLRVRSATGISELRTFWVGPFPIVAEKEPNSEFDHPQKIDLNVTVEGVVDNEDVDYFQIEAKQGQRISAEIEALRLGDAMFDPFVAILDSNRFVLASADDTALLKQDAFVSVVAPKDGSYIIQVRETSFGGGGESRYRLHVGTFPRPRGIYPSGGPAGQAVPVQFIGDVLGPIAKTLQLPAAPSEDFLVLVDHNGQTPPSANHFRVSPFPNVMEVEPNNEAKTATPSDLDAPFAFNGIISEKSDIDFFKFKAKKDRALEVNVYARRLHSPLDSVLTIYDAKGNQIAQNDDSGGPDSYLRFNPPADGEYLLSVRDHLNQGGPDYIYRVELTFTKPSVTLAIPNNGGQPTQERQTIPVPRGNRFATLIRATRANMGGDVSIAAKDLPDGMKMDAAPVVNGGDVAPVVFEANADAPLAGKLGDLIGHPLDPNVKDSDGTFHQVVELVYGPNNTSYHKIPIDHLTAAVTEEAPFKIDIVEPKVPLVQNGSMNLKVVATRKEGFKGVISLRMLFNPPGVGSAPSIDIPADKTEALYPLNCADNVPARKWKIAILGSSDVNGPLWVSSQLANLEIVAPMIIGKLNMAAAEQGATTNLVCEIEQKTPIAGRAKAQLLGLPANVTAEEKEIGPEDKKIVFDVVTTPKSPPGQHGGLLCQITMIKDGEPIVQAVGRGGTLRVDAPLPPKPSATTKPAQVVEATTKPAAPPPPKTLTRLEKLRLEQEQAAKEGKTP